MGLVRGRELHPAKRGHRQHASGTAAQKLAETPRPIRGNRSARAGAGRSASPSGARASSRPRAAAALAELIDAVRARTLIVSFNDEGYISRQEMEALLASRGPVTTIRRPYRRYVGARIGIYNPSGEKVGRVSHRPMTSRTAAGVTSP